MSIRPLKSLLVVTGLLLSGCATVQRGRGMNDIDRLVASRTEQHIVWNQGTAADSAVADTIRAMLTDSLTADQAVRIALLNNRSLQALYEEVGVAQADLVQAGLLRNPFFSVSARFPGTGTTNLEFGIVQSFIDLFQRPLRRRVAAANFEGTKLRVATEVVRFATDVRSSFYVLQGAEQLIELRQTTLRAAQASFAAAKAIHDAGNSTDLELDTEQSLRDQAVVDLTQAIADAAVARQRLAGGLGTTGGTGGSTGMTSATGGAAAGTSVTPSGGSATGNSSSNTSRSTTGNTTGTPTGAPVSPGTAAGAQNMGTMGTMGTMNMGTGSMGVTSDASSASTGAMTAGLLAGTPWHMASRLPTVPVVDPILAMQPGNLAQMAVGRRLDVSAAAQNVIVAARLLGLTRSFRLLQDGTLGFDAERDIDGKWVKGPTASFPLPIFDRGGPAVARGQAFLRQALAQHDALQVQVRAQVLASLARLSAAHSGALYYGTVIIPLRHRIVAETQRQYNAMTVGVFALLQARQAEIEAGRAYVDAVRDYWVSRSELQGAVGGNLPLGTGTAGESALPRLTPLPPPSDGAAPMNMPGMNMPATVPADTNPTQPAATPMNMPGMNMPGSPTHAAPTPSSTRSPAPKPAAPDDNRRTKTAPKRAVPPKSKPKVKADTMPMKMPGMSMPMHPSN